MSNWFGDVADNVGSAFKLPELGISELWNGGNATNRTSNSAGVNLVNSPVGWGLGTNGAYTKASAPVNTPSGPTNPAGGSTFEASALGDLLGSSLGGSGGGGSTAPTYDPAAMAYYQDQIDKANSAMGRIGAQRNIGNDNINNSYESALNTLLSSNGVAERNAGIQRQSTIDDNVNARAAVDQTVSRQANSLRKLLGNSSAGMYAAPLAVAQQGNEQQGAIQTSFGRNLQGFDLADEDRKRQLRESQGSLINQRDTSRNTLESGLQTNEASLNEQLSGLQTQKAQAAGQNYAQARGATQGYSDRIGTLLNSIDQLGRNPTIAAKDVSFTAPTLDKYKTSNIDVAQGGNAAQQQAGQYWNTLTDEKKKQQGLL